MAQLLLVNPSPRKRKKKMAARRTRTRTAKQKAATRKLVAFNKRRRSPKRNPAPRRKKAVKRRRTTTAIARRSPARRSPVRRRTRSVRKYKRNPTTRKAMMANIMDKQIKPAFVQAGGAVVLDVAYGYLGSYIPDVLNTGMARHATKGVAAIALSFIASNFVKNTTANQLAVGALTVTMHDAMKEGLANFAPNIPLGYYNASPTYNNDAGSMGAFTNDRGTGYSNLGAFTNDMGSGYADNNQMGFNTEITY